MWPPRDRDTNSGDRSAAGQRSLSDRLPPVFGPSSPADRAGITRHVRYVLVAAMLFIGTSVFSNLFF